MGKSRATVDVTIIHSNEISFNHECLEKYNNVLEDIVSRTTEFNLKVNKGFEECQKLNEHINNEERELKERCNRELITYNLNLDMLKAFIVNCTKYLKCPNKSPDRAGESVELQSKTLESKENHTSDNPEQLKTQKEPSSAPETTAGQKDALSLKIISAGDSGPNSSSVTVPLSRGGHQSHSDNVASSDSNIAGKPPSGNTHKGQNHDNQGIKTETSDVLSFSLEANGSRLNAQGDRVNKENNVAGRDEAVSQSAANSHGVSDSVKPVIATSDDVPLPAIHSTGQQPDNGSTLQSSAVTTLTSSSQKDGSGIVEDTGETVSLGDGFIMVFKKITLMSLIPLAIILLLTFLVKFTPLGTLFTNKKTKKKKHMNEKLQRILQESSVVNDQRTVPFSYGSFEYSSY